MNIFVLLFHSLLWKWTVDKFSLSFDGKNKEKLKIWLHMISEVIIFLHGLKVDYKDPMFL